MSDPNSGEAPLTPEARALIARARRSFLFSIGLLLLGLLAVGGAIVYKSTQGGSSAPSGADYVIAALKIGGVLERIGDYSKNIAKRVGSVEDRRRFEPLTLLPAMAELAAGMVHDVLTAFAARDPMLARKVIERDDKVDAFYDSIFRNLVSYMVENPATISSAAQLLFVARNIERIGDHATNVAEMVHYAATGHHPTDIER